MMFGLLLSVAAHATNIVAGGPVLLTLEAYGERLQGELVVDADALAARGVTLRMHGSVREGSAVGLVHGMKISGVGSGDQVVQQALDAIDGLDFNGDGWLDADDATFSSVRLFVDRNGDGVAQPDELLSLDAIGITRISRYGEIHLAARSAR